jgi:hypothetical protein
MNVIEWRKWLSGQVAEAGRIITENADDLVGNTPLLMDLDITIRVRQGEATTIELMRTHGVLDRRPVDPEVIDISEV